MCISGRCSMCQHAMIDRREAAKLKPIAVDIETRGDLLEASFSTPNGMAFAVAFEEQMLMQARGTLK